MKVLILTGDYPTRNSNASIFTHNQVKALQSKGIDVRVLEVDMRSIRRLRRWGYKKDMHDGIVVYRMAVPCGPIPPLLDIWSPIAGEYAFKRIVKDWGMPDLLHTHFSATAAPAIRIKEKYNLPLVLTEHGSGLLEQNLTERNKCLFVAGAASAQKIIAVSASLMQSLSKLTTKPIEVVPNIVPNIFCDTKGIKNQEFTFISVGNHGASKRFDLTICAFSRVLMQRPSAKLVIVGDGPLKIQLQELAQQLKVSGSVIFTGTIPNKELPQLYARCQCFVLPSMFETFGVVYAEAIACGIPVIATRCGGPEDIVNENNGVLIAKDSEDELYDAMKLMVERSGMYDSQKMSEDIRDRFGEDAVASRLIEIYEQTLRTQ